MHLIILALLLSADFTGTWVGRIPTGRQGAMQDIAFKLVQNGTTVTGKLYGDYQSSPIVEGKITGEEIVFVLIAPDQTGNQINETRFRFTGAMKDGEIELTRIRESATNAGNAGTYQYREREGAKPPVFRLKRLL
jgi:hypothetical protein